MKRIFGVLGFCAVLCTLTACPKQSDPFFVAKTTIAGARTAITLTDFAFAKAVEIKSAQCTDAVCIKVDPDKGTKYKECMIQDHSANADYQVCFKTMKNVIGYWDKGKALATTGCNTADEAVKLAQKIDAAKKAGNQEELAKACAEVDPTKGAEYEKCMKGEPVALLDYLAIIKSAMCSASKALAFMPESFSPYLKSLTALFDSYGCKN